MAIYLGTNEVSIGGTSGNGFMMNGRLIATRTYTLKLSDTNFATITPSTATTTLTLPPTAYTTTTSILTTCFRVGRDYDGVVIDLTRHDYVILFETSTNYNYSSTVAGTIHGIKSAYTRDLQIGNYHNSIIAATGTLNTSTISYGSTYLTSVSRLLYQKADNTYGISTTNYGFYCVSSTPVATAASYLNLNLRDVCIRGNDTYFPVDAITALNPANTSMTTTWYVYEGDKSMYGQLYSRVTELASN